MLTVFRLIEFEWVWEMPGNIGLLEIGYRGVFG